MTPKTSQRNLARRGSAVPSERPVRLRAGRLTLSYCDGAVRSVMAGNVEIVRRIYVAVRDRFWNTVRPVVSDVRIQKGTSSFCIEFDCRHVRPGIDFVWHAKIDGTESGALLFSMQGESRSSFEANRIGFCVLHPLKECAGKPCTVEFTNGKRARVAFPDAISPHQPFRDMRALRMRFGAALRSELRFEGETFEMEDQRNWTDASFKTYCPPLLRTIPRCVEKGESFSQRIVVRVTGAYGRAKNSRNTRPVHVEFAGASVPLPAIGIAISGPGRHPGTREAELLKACRFSHARADVSVDNQNWATALKCAADGAALMNAPLEVALHFRNQSRFLRKDARGVCTLLDAHRACVTRFLVLRGGEKVTSRDTLSAVQKTLGTTVPAGGIVTGTNGYFVEINRHLSLLQGATGICYSATPQVHTFDDTIVMENLDGLAPTVAAARQRFPRVRVFVTPVTLRPRPNPESPQKDHGPDPRQKSLLGAVWTLGSIVRLARAGASGITYFETTGDCGIMVRGGKRVFPMYHVFADVGEFSGGRIRFQRDVAARGLVACSLEREGKKRYLVANLTAASKNVFLRGLPPVVHRVRLNETTFGQACCRPLEFRKDKRAVEKTIHGTMRVRMLPYEIVRLDADR
jgi:hypothetical protein